VEGGGKGGRVGQTGQSVARQCVGRERDNLRGQLGGSRGKDRRGTGGGGGTGRERLSGDGDAGYVGLA